MQSKKQDDDLPGISSRASIVGMNRPDTSFIERQLDRSHRSPCHNGRPSVEEVPKLSVPSFRKLGVLDEPQALNLKAVEGPVEVLVAVRVNEKRLEMELAWDMQPKIGSPETLRLTRPLLPIYPGAGGVFYRTICPTCDRRAKDLHWIGRTWVCAQCLHPSPYETLRRRDPIYSRRKLIARAREAMGCPGPLLSPIIVKRGADRDLAEKLHAAEMEVFAAAAARLEK